MTFQNLFSKKKKELNTLLSKNLPQDKLNEWKKLNRKRKALLTGKRVKDLTNFELKRLSRIDRRFKTLAEEKDRNKARLAKKTISIARDIILNVYKARYDKKLLDVLSEIEKELSPFSFNRILGRIVELSKKYHLTEEQEAFLVIVALMEAPPYFKSILFQEDLLLKNRKSLKNRVASVVTQIRRYVGVFGLTDEGDRILEEKFNAMVERLAHPSIAYIRSHKKFIGKVIGFISLFILIFLAVGNCAERVLENSPLTDNANSSSFLPNIISTILAMVVGAVGMVLGVNGISGRFGPREVTSPDLIKQAVLVNELRKEIREILEKQDKARMAQVLTNYNVEFVWDIAIKVAEQGVVWIFLADFVRPETSKIFGISNERAREIGQALERIKTDLKLKMPQRIEQSVPSDKKEKVGAGYDHIPERVRERVIEFWKEKTCKEKNYKSPGQVVDKYKRQHPESEKGKNLDISALLWHEIAASILGTGAVALYLGYDFIDGTFLALFGSALGVYFHEMYHFVAARKLILEKTLGRHFPRGVGIFHQELIRALTGEPSSSYIRVGIDKRGIQVIYHHKLLNKEENLKVNRSGSRANVRLLLTFGIFGIFLHPVFTVIAVASLIQGSFSTFREGMRKKDKPRKRKNQS